MRTALSSVWSFLLAWKYSTAGVLAFVLVGAGVAWSMSGEGEIAGVTDEKPSVRVARVSELMGGSSLSIVAEVTSVSEAKISTETGGRIVRVRAKLGDFVSAGQVLAEMENGSQRAALLQAEGALDAAKASAPNIQTSLEGAQNGAVNTLLSSYATYESTVHDTIDEMFTNPGVNSLKFNIISSDSQAKAQLENQHANLTRAIQRQTPLSSSLNASADLSAELDRTAQELRALRSYLDMLIKVLNGGIPSPEASASTIASHLAAATGARTSVTGSLSAITAAQSALESAKNASGDSGVVTSSAAGIKQAQGAYNAALASLEKTIIRSPISGSLNNFTIKLGDFVSPTQQVAIVSNNGALEAVAYISEEDRERVVVGQKVTFDGGTTGTITRVAPALDPVTRRIEVRIGLPSGTKLTNGQSVRVELVRGAATPISGPISIPITALKMESNRNSVFTVVDNKLVSQEITIGKLSGEFVQVSSGLTRESEIVVDARGLSNGDEVAVQ
jgi:multidrug efflux pump subunit AcrA (membrane-fusion protein)